MLTNIPTLLIAGSDIAALSTKFIELSPSTHPRPHIGTLPIEEEVLVDYGTNAAVR